MQKSNQRDIQFKRPIFRIKQQKILNTKEGFMHVSFRRSSNYNFGFKLLKIRIHDAYLENSRQRFKKITSQLLKNSSHIHIKQIK